jgi:hypothetical protein
MKKLFITSFLIIHVCLNAIGKTNIDDFSSFCYITTIGAINVGNYNNLNLYIIPKENKGNINIYQIIASGTQWWNIYINNGFVKNIQTTSTNHIMPVSISEIQDCLIANSVPNLFKFNLKGYNWYFCFYILKETETISTACTGQPYLISVISSSPIHWEKSSNNGLNWSTINSSQSFYSETNPTTGTYLYRVLNGDETYSAIKQVTYQDAVPTSISISPSNSNTKTVDENIILSSSTTDTTYNYQWYKDETAISNATTSSYSIPTIKSADTGTYSCIVSNGCNSVTSAAANLTVNKAAQTITISDIPTKTYGDGAFTLPATTDKGLTIAYQSTNTAVATVSGNTVTIVAPGTANIIASQNGNADYLAATGVTKTLTVNKIAQNIILAATATKTFGDATFTLPATSDKNKTITYTSSNTAVATVNGNTVTIKGAGITDLSGTQAGDTYYYAAPTATQTLTVNKANQTITFSTFATKTYGDAAITLPTTSSAGLTISYSSNNTAVASVSGNTLTLNKAGTATITASQSGNTNYAAASSVSQDITIQKANQTIVWSNIPNKTYGDAAFTLPATTDKGLTIAYQSADTTIAKVSGNTVTIKGAGTVNITASQAGSDNYNAAISVTLPLSVSKAVQTITFADLPAYTYGANPVTLAASTNSGTTVTYDSSDPNVASVSGNTLTINNAGNCYITASVAGNSNYLTGTPVQKLLTVNKANQIVTLDAITDKTYGDVAFTLSASANTGLPVTFSSGTPAKLIVSGSTATIAGAGTYTITATQAGNSNYNSAKATRTLIVNKVLLIATADSKTRLYGDANPTLTVSYSGFVNGDSKAELAAMPVATTTATSASTVGTYDITLSTITDGNYTLTYRKGTLTVNKAALMVTANNASKVYGDANPTFTMSYAGFKNNETTTVLTTLPAVATVAKTMSNIGTYDLICSGGVTTNYDISYTNGQLTIAKATLKVFASDVSKTYGDTNPTFTMNISGYKGSDDVTIFTKTPTPSCSASEFSTAGTYNITYSGGTADNYQFDFATTIGKLTINKAPLNISVRNDTINIGDSIPNFKLDYNGFKGIDGFEKLEKLPTIICSANNTLTFGTYDIILSGGYDKNYSYNLTNGKLVVKDNTGLNIINTFNASLYPVPTNNRVFIQSDMSITRVEVYSIEGRLLLINTSDKIMSIDLSELMEGTYICKLHSSTGVMTKMIIKN